MQMVRTAAIWALSFVSLECLGSSADPPEWALLVSEAAALPSLYLYNILPLSSLFGVSESADKLVRKKNLTNLPGMSREPRQLDVKGVHRFLSCWCLLWWLDSFLGHVPDLFTWLFTLLYSGYLSTGHLFDFFLLPSPPFSPFLPIFLILPSIYVT